MNYENIEDLIEDEIIEIECIGEEDTIDINVTGNRLFFANDILTHNSAVEEVSFDHSHIAGGISKINTADYVFGIITSRALKERGKYQIQCMKSRSSTGVGQQIELDYSMDTMRISDSGGDNNDEPKTTASDIMNRIRSNGPTENSDNTDDSSTGKIVADVRSTKLSNMLKNMKTK